MELLCVIASMTAALVAIITLVVVLARRNDGGAFEQTKEELIRTTDRALAASSSAAARQMDMLDTHIAQKQEALSRAVASSMAQMEQRIKSLEMTNEQKLDAIRTAMEQRLQYLQEDNNRRLDDMRKTVDEKLQKTLEDTMTQSFRLVNERLEQVYKGLGEMQTLAGGVGDLKKVLSNVKTRGILGEIQLAAILEEILTPEQYDTNVATVPDSKAVVEFAVKLPGTNGEQIYLPIDSKFPGDAYAALQDAYESGDPAQVQAAATVLCNRIRSFAKDIRDKYIEPPFTTDFAIMFLPFEGLYAEAVNRGLVEVLQRECKVNLAGPSTMAALLNSLQMGFRTLAIQKQSGEVWKLLGAVRTEFDKFNDILLTTQSRLDQANRELDKLVGVRTRAIQRRLRDVERVDEQTAAQWIESDATNE